MVFGHGRPQNSMFLNKYVFILLSDIYGGYLCFVVSIFSIGVVTAVIGDVASHFGCTLGIKDSVTAIVFVALGTSIPGKFIKKKKKFMLEHCKINQMAYWLFL